MTAGPLHTILGANGAVGRALSAELSRLPVRVRQVARTPRAESEGDELVAADLLDAAATDRAVAGSDVVYLLAGLPYSAALWEAQWPRVMQHVLDACTRHGARLVFFDNVYPYGAVDGVMTEETPFNPCSRKGEVRARITTTLLDAMRRQQLTAMIVRSADFYYPDGAGATTGLLNGVVFDRLAAGHGAQWLGSADVVHSFTYTPDIARTLAHLSARDDAYGQSWHALTSPEARTGREFVQMACAQLGQPVRVQNAGRTMLRLLGLFNPVLREQLEMLYQFERPYRFSSAKLERASGLVPTSYAAGFADVIARLPTGAPRARTA
ncbi:MAG: NAD-dependent epimerase/dehydratase family protein [Gemmatimonadaceae bacterium]|nr:NAD-dependent epimerase/dehydratase family protein [Gemmatimonadaceae bacterium]